MLKTLFMSIVFASLAYSPLSAAQGVGRWLTVEQIADDIALIEEVYSRVHPGYARYASTDDLAKAWLDIVTEAKASEGMSEGDFYLQIQHALTLIRCDHSKAELPDMLKEGRDVTPVYLPFRWTLVEGRGFVTIVQPGSKLNRFDEILEIDGRPLHEMVSEVEPYIPFDGNTRWSRGTGVSESLEFQGGAVDHFGALLWDIKPTATIKIRSSDNVEREISLDRITYSAWSDLDGANASGRNFKDAVNYRKVGDTAAYLSVETFVNYRAPVDPDSIFDPIFESIAEEERTTLILDLRENGGGSSDARLRLAANLINKPTVFKKDIQAKTLDLDGIRHYLWTWDKRALNPDSRGFAKNKNGLYSLKPELDKSLMALAPAEHAFNGHLIILTSNNNSSGSASLIAVLKDTRQVTLVGERTGGSSEGATAGILFTLTLPRSGIKARVPFLRSYNNVSSFEPGMGITPDIMVPQTVVDLLAGRDPALEAAKTLVKGLP